MIVGMLKRSLHPCDFDLVTEDHLTANLLQHHVTKNQKNLHHHATKPEKEGVTSQLFSLVRYQLNNPSSGEQTGRVIIVNPPSDV